MRPLAFLLLLLIATPSNIRADDAADKTPGPSAADLGAADLADVLEPIRAEHDVVALAAAVMRGDQLEAIGAVGVRRVGKSEAVGLLDKFHIGSCTKSMTATLCAIVVEQGKLRWDSTIAEVFADQKDDILPAYHEVTLSDLLNHRSGLGEDRSPGQTFMKLRMMKSALPEQRRELIRLVLSRPPAHEPRSTFAYSNYGIAIAGAMAERATGKGYEELMQELLFKPLGITSGGFGAPGEASKVDHPWGHGGVTSVRPIRPSKLADNPAAIAPAGTAHLSLPDWGRYAALQLAAGRGEDTKLLSAETWQRLHSDPFEQGYGYGWGQGERPWAGRVLLHSGSNTMWFAMILLAPEQNLAIMVATNQANAPAREAVRAAGQALANKYGPKVEEASTAGE